MYEIVSIQMSLLNCFREHGLKEPVFRNILEIKASRYMEIVILNTRPRYLLRFLLVTVITPWLEVICSKKDYFSLHVTFITEGTKTETQAMSLETNKQTKPTKEHWLLTCSQAHIHLSFPKREGIPNNGLGSSS